MVQPCGDNHEKETSYNNNMLINESDIDDKIQGAAELNRLMRATNAAHIHLDKMRDRLAKSSSNRMPKYYMDAQMDWADAWSAWLYAATYPQESATWIEGNNELVEYAMSHLKRHSDYCKTLAADSEQEED